jgi:hypothetical protein
VLTVLPLFGCAEGVDISDDVVIIQLELPDAGTGMAAASPDPAAQRSSDPIASDPPAASATPPATPVEGGASTGEAGSVDAGRAPDRPADAGN